MEPEEEYECVAHDPRNVLQSVSAHFSDSATRVRLAVLNWINEQLAEGFPPANIQVFQVHKTYEHRPHDHFN